MLQLEDAAGTSSGGDACIASRWSRGMVELPAFERELARISARCSSNRSSAAILVVCAARLSFVNNLQGYAAGELIITRMAGGVRDFLASSGGPGRGAAARIGGSQFAVLLADCAAHDLHAAATGLRRSVAFRIAKSGPGSADPDVRVGGCLLGPANAGAREGIAIALDACREAAESPRDPVVLRDTDLREVARRCADACLASQVANAISRRRVELAYQPVIGASTGLVHFHEALARLGTDPAGHMAATRFIPVAEKLGLIGDVDRLVLCRALSVLCRRPDLSISVNVAARSLESSAWMSELTRRIADRPDVARRLIIELTESQAARHPSETRKLVSAIRALGSRVAIDDFGAGYTSFALLRDLPVDIVKIDGSFTRDLRRDPRNGTFIRSLVTLGRAIGAHTVAEWVEDASTAHALTEWGVDYLQGDFLGPATSEEPEKNPSGQS